ncbi:hypothetical protein ACJIZ3_006716 [Penstemon smallii]|uniref:Subtilisin-like protease n=1 Tax=Penstemon smallii TaxID=265156 RepID=A0ABD3S8R1_9LAMI
MLFPKFLIFFLLSVVFQESALAVKKSYIVYLGAHSHGPEVTKADLERVKNSHYELLSSFVESEEKARDAIFYSYKRHINGFAALLEEEEAAEIAKHPEVVSVFLNEGKKLHTTRSWDFMLLANDGHIPPSSIWKKARFGEDTIIANLDTGVWPESKSFSGEGYGPIPSKWKGKCQLDDKAKFPCNRKLIGARYFNKGYEAYVGKLNSTFNSPRDKDGHGSHTLSTAGGNFVPGANVQGVGNGTAKGGSPKARVASYKVCWPVVDGGSCFYADILKGFETAIQDGVDVLSVSLGGKPTYYFTDGIAIGSFHAVKNGLVVVAGAGNSGPSLGTVSNVAPWIITVGASTIDRIFQANVKLHNGVIIKGTSLSKALPHNKFYRLINAAHAKAPNSTVEDAILCKPGTLDSNKVKGKIIVCLRGDTARIDKGLQALSAGAAGMILANDNSTGNEIIADVHILPSTHINYKDGQILFAYVNSTILNTKPAPIVANFSSRGPNVITPEILKPDITAPGVNIIAAYSEAPSPFDKRRFAFIAESGTSVSCPHVSGVVGLLKTIHPKWSSAAIRSAIMTTARTRDNTMKAMVDSSNSKATPFDFGSGHIRPNKATDPGLVYDLTVNDYLDFLCGIGYNETVIRQFSGSAHNCPKNYSLLSFNYPSITVPNLNSSAVTLTRKLKNVGMPGTYVAYLRQPKGFSASVEPKTLKFKKIGQEKTFTVTVEKTRGSKDFEFGLLTWTDGQHYVRSPVLVYEAGVSY